METKDILRLREEIDRIDDEILDCLSRRASCALKIGGLKQSTGAPTIDAVREREVLTALLTRNPGPLPEAALKNIFTEIISACRTLQTPTRVAFLGPEGTFSHLAAMKYFGRSTDFLPTDSIADVFRAVERGHADLGVVPVENSSEGAVGQTLDQLAISNVGICGEVFSKVSLALMSREEEPGRITRVYSHPQGLAQCLGWLSSNLPGRAIMPVASTSAAARQASEEEGAAAVGSEMLADLYNLKVLARDIQDWAFNQTRFLIIGTIENRPTQSDKTSVLFATAHKPGALREALTPFAERGINMTRIESRPAKDRPWDYIFFVDFEGHLSNSHVAAAMDALASSARKLKILGSYPTGEPMDQRPISQCPAAPVGDKEEPADQCGLRVRANPGAGNMAAGQRSVP